MQNDNSVFIVCPLVQNSSIYCNKRYIYSPQYVCVSILLKMAQNSSCMALLQTFCTTQLLLITMHFLLKFSFIYPLKQTGVLYL